MKKLILTAICLLCTAVPAMAEVITYKTGVIDTGTTFVYPVYKVWIDGNVYTLTRMSKDIFQQMFTGDRSRPFYPVTMTKEEFLMEKMKCESLRNE